MERKLESRIERKKEETKNRIIGAAVILFSENGLNAVTMEQIAEAADVAKGTLYNYFPAKESIISAYIQKSFKDTTTDRLEKIRSLADTRSRLTYLFNLLIEGVQRQKEVFETFMVYRMKQVISFQPVEAGEQSGLSLMIQEIVNLGIQSGELRSDLPVDILEGLVEYALIAAIKPFYLHPESFQPQKAIDQCVDLFINGSKS